MKARTLIAAGLPVRARTNTTLICLWTACLALATIVFGPQRAWAAMAEAWVQRYGSEAGTADYGYRVVADAAGNIIVAGNTVHNQAGSRSDMLVIKYSGEGIPLWTNRYTGLVYIPGGVYSKSSLAIGSDGAVYVTGVSRDGLSSSDDFVTVKYVSSTEIAIEFVSAIPPTVNLKFSGPPNSSWAIERAQALTGPWMNLSALVIGTNGSAQFQDTTPASPAGFYRARQK